MSQHKVAAILVAALAMSARAPAAEKPNIVVILSDDMDYS